jgi:hypothetical protein
VTKAVKAIAPGMKAATKDMQVTTPTVKAAAMAGKAATEAAQRFSLTA